MRIGLFTDTYYPQLNGVVTSVRTLERELKSLGHIVYVFTSSDPFYKSHDDNLYLFPSVPFLFYKPYRLASACFPTDFYNIKKMNLDIIHTQTEFTLGAIGKFASKFFKIPIVHTYHTMYEDYVHYIANGHIITPKMVKKYSAFFCNAVDTIIAPTLKVKMSLKQYGVMKPISVIPTGIFLEEFKKNFSKDSIEKIRNNYNISKDDFLILSIGRVDQEKNIDLLINQMPNILKQICNAKLLIVGDGQYINQLKLLVYKLHLDNKVFFSGKVRHDDIYKYYKIGDVFVTCSSSETQGLTSYEAMASGIPVIAKCDESINAFIQNNYNGFIFNEPSDIPDILYKLYRKKTLTDYIVSNASKTVEKLSSKSFAKNVIKVYNSIIDYKSTNY